MMGKIIQLPIPNQQIISDQPTITQDEALERIKALSWAAPKAFFTLQANCLSLWPMEMSDEIKEKLWELHLIDDSGHIPPTVCAIMHTISESKLMAAN